MDRPEVDAVVDYLCEQFIDINSGLSSAISYTNKEASPEEQIPPLDLMISFNVSGIISWCHTYTAFDKCYHDICDGVINKLNNKTEVKVLRDKVASKMKEKFSEVKTLDNDTIKIPLLY